MSVCTEDGGQCGGTGGYCADCPALTQQAAPAAALGHEGVIRGFRCVMPRARACFVVELHLVDRLGSCSQGD
jgi:hypothetical protein